jgi:hypothetical protein
MMFRTLTALSLLALAACGAEPAVGDACEAEADCGDLHCHIDEGETVGECELEEEDDMMDDM